MFFGPVGLYVMIRDICGGFDEEDKKSSEKKDASTEKKKKRPGIIWRMRKKWKELWTYYIDLLWFDCLSRLYCLTVIVLFVFHQNHKQYHLILVIVIHKVHLFLLEAAVLGSARSQLLKIGLFYHSFPPAWFLIQLILLYIVCDVRHHWWWSSLYTEKKFAYL